jgi:hypothetical protein
LDDILRRTQMIEKRFKVTNTTVKKPKIDPETNKDLRSAIERVGHSVSFRDENDKLIVLAPGRVRIVSHIDGGLLGFRRAGMVSIEEIKDVTTALKEHTLQETPIQKKEKPKVRSAHAVEMGKDDHGEGKKVFDEGYEGAVNPDGASNHRVVAPHNKKGKKQRTHKQRNADEALLNLEE